MEVIIYRAKIKDDWLYDMSFNPNVDYEVLRKTRKIDGIEALTPFIPLEKGQEILNKIYGKSLLKKFIDPQSFYVKQGLKSMKGRVDFARTNLHTSGIVMPPPEEIAIVERCITGRVLTLRRLFEISPQLELTKQQVLDIVQILYCERRIRVVASVKRVKGKEVCTFCERSSCFDCCMDFQRDDILLYAADNYNLGLPTAISYRKKKLPENLNRAHEGISNFLDNTRRHHATLWCVPNSFDYSVLGEAVAKVLSNGGKLLYITSSLLIAEAELELSQLVEGAAVSVVDGNTLEYKDIDITLCAYNDYPCFHKSFDLVVLDERMIHIDKALRNMLSISKRAVKEKGKLIHITHIPDFKDKEQAAYTGEIVTIPVNGARAPIPEPLIVISRLLNESIPEIVIDTINWSIKEKQRMLIFVPDDDVRFGFYNKLTSLMDIDSNEVEFSTVQDKTAMLKLKKKELSLVISNDLRDTGCVIDDLNVIVMNADHDSFTKEALVNICAMAVYHTRKKCGQVIFVVEKDCEAANKTKDSIRGINKIAWESGLVKK